MISIRLLHTFRLHHLAIEQGEILALRPELARRLVGLGVAEYSEPQREIVEAEQIRTESILSGGYQRRGRRRVALSGDGSD